MSFFVQFIYFLICLWIYLFIYMQEAKKNSPQRWSLAAVQSEHTWLF